MVQLSHPYMIIGKTTALTRQTFFDKIMSLLFNMLSRFVIAFLPRSKFLLISWLQSSSAVILEPIIPTIVWSQAKPQGGNTAPPISRNCIKGLLSMALPARARPIFPMPVSPITKLSQASYPHHQRADRRKIKITEN